ncbi:MAG: S41 family peptidase [Bacteroidota bacterium]
MRINKQTALVFSFLCVLSVGFLAGFWMHDDDDKYFALRKNFQIFGALYEQLVTDYVDDLNPETLMRTGIDAMLTNLDPYTNFFDEADNGDIEIMTRGRYGGVGLNVGMRNGKMTVISPTEGTSGYLQGVRTGDILIEVAGQPTSGLSFSDVRNILRGEPGTAVEISLSREGIPEPLDFLLTREEIQLKNVTHAGFIGEGKEAGVGYVKLARFTRDASKEVKEAIEQMQKESQVKGLILDLRDNRGGLLDEAVSIAQFFVPKGSVIVSTRGRLPQTENTYRSKVTPIFPDLPVVVLINDMSASASEIVAGALQDLDRGVIIGSTSFGKGLVQIVKPLPYNTSLKITTSQYFTPSGRSIQAIDYKLHDGAFSEIPDSLRRTFKTAAGRLVKDGRGIEPDLPVSLGASSELEQALIRRAAFFFFANHFAASQPTINTDFVIDDKLYDAFRAWLNTQDFSYRTRAEMAAEQLGSNLEDIGYAAVADEMSALQEAIREEKATDFERHKVRLQERLRVQILARYHGDAAQTEAALAVDPQYASAIEMLGDHKAYQQVFLP